MDREDCLFAGAHNAHSCNGSKRHSDGSNKNDGNLIRVDARRIQLHCYSQTSLLCRFEDTFTWKWTGYPLQTKRKSFTRL